MSLVRDGLARSVQVRLARHAKEIGVDPNLLLAWPDETLRPTRDADLLGFGDLRERLATAFDRARGKKVNA